MSILVDNQIDGMLPGLASGVPANDFQEEGSQVQAASLNLTIGNIYVPGTESEKPGGAYTPTKQFTLEQGHTAVIKTAETLNLGSGLAGIAFPPASLSLKGLLMTNPGHIDPGYKGPLHITVINMSRLPFQLRAGDRIMRVLFLQLAGTPSAPLNARKANSRVDVIDPALLDQLSIDFLNVKERAEKVANGALNKATVRATAIPLAVGILAFMASLFGNYAPLRDDVKKIDVRLSVIEANQSSKIEGRIRKLEEQLTAVH
jgi:deoxycytidine triphosphate deaminase